MCGGVVYACLCVTVWVWVAVFAPDNLLRIINTPCMGFYLILRYFIYPTLSSFFSLLHSISMYLIFILSCSYISDRYILLQLFQETQICYFSKMSCRVRKLHICLTYVCLIRFFFRLVLYVNSIINQTINIDNLNE